MALRRLQGRRLVISGILLASLLAGLTAFDTIHILQWMLSRPIVVGSIVGAAMGKPDAGMLCGACIELVWLGVLPIGNYVPPDAHAAAACSATAISVWSMAPGVPLAGGVLLAVLVCVPIGILSKLGDFRIRSALGKRAEEIMKTEPPYALGGLCLVVSLSVFLKAGVLVLVVGVLAMVSEPAVIRLFANDRVHHGMEFAASFLPALGMVQIARCLGARGREKWVLAGAVIALAVLFASGILR